MSSNFKTRISNLNICYYSLPSNRHNYWPEEQSPSSEVGEAVNPWSRDKGHCRPGVEDASQQQAVRTLVVKYSFHVMGTGYGPNHRTDTRLCY